MEPINLNEDQKQEPQQTDQRPFAYPNYQSSLNRNNNKVSPTLVVGAVILVLVIGTFLIIGQTKKSKEVVKEEAKTTTEISTPTPTKKPEIDKKTVKIQVINGTGTPGQAGEVVKSLEEDGYVTENIKTGNAKEFDNTSTTIEAKVNYEDVAADIKKMLSSTFDSIKVLTTTLDKDSDYDIVIITGGKLYQTPTPEVSPTTSASTLTVTPDVTTTPTPTLTPSPTP